MEKSYTSEEGTFTLKVNVVNHQEKPVLDSETLKDSISVLINGKEASYRGKMARRWFRIRQTRRQK